MGYQGEKTPRHTDDNGCCLDDFAILFILPHDPLSSLTAEPLQTSIEWIVENTGHVSNVTDMIKSQDAYNGEVYRLVSIFMMVVLGSRKILI